MARVPSSPFRWTVAVLGVAFLGLCLAPAWLRLRNPTLYADDVVRIVHLQTHPLGDLLFRPFNEHMSPLFEIVTWSAWDLAGRRITRAPLALVLASCVPFAATLGLLGLVIRLELRSTGAALGSVALFGLASLDGEVLNWYSASSFTWASAATLLAWLGASASAKATSRMALIAWLGLALAGSLAGPGFSAIGLIAAPLAASRLILDDSASRRRRWLGASVPMAGALIYLAVCESFRYRDVLASGLGRHVSPSTALWNLGRAPIDVLVPGLFGLRNLDRFLPDWLEIGLSGLALIGVLVWAWFQPRHRPLILGGLALIVGGYAVTYGVRTLPDARQVINVQRYHLFPQLGLVFLLGPVLAVLFRSLEGRRIATLVAANLLAMVVLWVHLPQMKEHLRFFRFPEQPPTLEALDRLEASCREQGISRDQVLKAFDPIRPTWVPSDGNALELLAGSIDSARQADDEVRTRLMTGRSTTDREALCGGMEATAHRVTTSTSAKPSTARLIRRSRVEPTGLDRFVSAGWPAYLEYRIDPEADDARALTLPDVQASHDLELWWADADGRWSPNRSAWWRPTLEQGWAVPLDQLPHWQQGRVRTLRVYFHEAGAVALGEPRLFR